MTGDALRTQLAEVLNRESVDCGSCVRSLTSPINECPDCERVLFHVADALLPVIAAALARARAVGAAEALRDAEAFARQREGELYQDWRAPHLTPLIRRRIEGEQHGWQHAADNLAARATSALSAHTTEGDPT